MKVIIVLKRAPSVLSYDITEITTDKLTTISQLVPIETIAVINDKGQRLSLGQIEDMINVLNDIMTRQILINDCKGDK